MSKTMRTLAWLLFWICIAPGSAFAQRKETLIGKVLDADGKPVEGVSVTISSPQVPTFNDVETTNGKGVFTVVFPQMGATYHLRFDKPGFQSFELDEKGQWQGSRFAEWTMHPGQSAAPGAPSGGPPPASTSQAAIDAYNAGLAAKKAKDNAAAEAKFKEAVEHDPKLRQAWESLSLVAYDLEHNQEAAEAGDKAVELGSTDNAVLTARWQAYRKLGNEAKTTEAKADLEKFGRAAEEAKKFHNEAVALMKTNDYAGAFAKFQEALQLDPNLEPSLIGLAEAALKTGKNAEAADAAAAALKLDPNNEQAVRLRYNAALTLGDEAKLADALVSLAPYDLPVARNGLLKFAFDAYDKNDMPKAKDMFGKVVQVDPNYALAHWYLALIAVGEDDTANAKIHLERFLQLAPDDKEANSARDMLDYLNKKKR